MPKLKSLLKYLVISTSIIVASLIIIVVAKMIYMFIDHYSYIYTYREEIKLSRSFWITIIENDTPPKNFNYYLSNEQKRSADRIFYGFKIWFIDHSLKSPNKDDLSLDHAGKVISHINDKPIQTDNVAVTYRYGKNKQELHMVFLKKNGINELYPSLSLDDCFWNADKNNDGKVDKTDIIISMKNK